MAQNMEVSTAQVSGSASHPDPIATFPTLGQLVSDTVLKDMLSSLLSSLYTGMLSCVHQFKADIQDLGERVDKFETAMCDMTTSFNTMVDAQTSQSEEIAWLKNKMAELEE